MIQLIKPYVELRFPTLMPTQSELLKQIEWIGRVCYKSEDKITDDSAKEFVQRLIRRGHESVLEHISFTVKFVVDRGVTHELVRHRIASYSQESTRYCDYDKKGLVFILPPWVGIEPGKYSDNYLETTTTLWPHTDVKWFRAMEDAATTYSALLKGGWSPQQARSVLPNSLKTEIVTTMNLRQWRHVLRLRISLAAHPQMREIMCKLYMCLLGYYPAVFEDILA